MKILAIETSCDETAAAIVEGGTKILSSVVASSTDMHKKYGGIVPEIAAREQLKCIIPVIEEALSDLHKSNNPPAGEAGVTMYQCINDSIDAIAVTVGPGLIGSLLVGVETAKTIAFVTGKPIIPVNHVLAHMYANFIPSASEGQNSSRVHPRDNHIEFPAISLVVSGGHTELYLMTSMKDLTWLGGTLDDAAGECFDKSARLLGFGNQGGPAIAKAASTFDPQHSTFSIHLPRPMIKDESLNFSFSGLKTAIVREWKKYHITPDVKEVHTSGVSKLSSNSELSTQNSLLISAFAFEVQEAITDVLIEKTLRAAQIHKAKSILLSGGVAANLRLRQKFVIHHSTFSIHVPPISLCTDNAVYIGSYAFFRGKPTDWHEITAIPNLSVEIS